MMTVEAGSEATTAALCDKFTKSDGKRGKPARDSKCAVCETVWTEHFSEREPERGHQQPILHPEMVRVIPEPKRKRRPRAIVAAAIRKVADTVADFIDPDEEPDEEPEAEAEPDIDRMICGHPLTELQDIDGEESCRRCLALDRFWAKMKAWWMVKEKKRHPDWTQEQLEAQHEWESDW
jgi:hypothetical protein